MTLFRSKSIFATIALVGVIGAGIFPAPINSIAQEKIENPPTSDGRFHFEREGNGFVRLDKNSGETSFCRRIGDNLICSLAIEERDTLHSEIVNLQNKLAAAREKLDAVAATDPTLPRPKEKVPDLSSKDSTGPDRDNIEKEVDRAFEITRKTVRKLFDVVKELQKEFEDEMAK